MAFADTLTFSVKFGGLQVGASYDGSGGLRPDLNEVVPPSSMNLAVGWTVDVSEIDVLVLYATAAMTLKTNNSGSPADTISLAANTPIFWFTGCGLDCPLGTDVTVLYVTSSAGGTLSIRALVDPTP